MPHWCRPVCGKSDEAVERKRSRREKLRTRVLQRDPLAKVRTAALTLTEVAAWRDRHLPPVSGGTVRRDTPGARR